MNTLYRAAGASGARSKTPRGLVLGLLAFLSLLASASLGDDGKIPDGDVAAWVHKRVEAWQPTADERRFDQIGWVKDVREALRLAREHDRPVFLFTHDGRMGIGRC
ncbi:MAG: hypothetical protein HY000_04380 [Planctomycetes bacterium]|nr:hypothetical protein [Planctomycetota bacterium]